MEENTNSMASGGKSIGERRMYESTIVTINARKCIGRSWGSSSRKDCQCRVAPSRRHGLFHPGEEAPGW